MKKYLYIALAIITLGIAGWFIARHNKAQDTAIACEILPPDVREKIIVDPRRSKITVITKERTDELYMPDRPTAIIIPLKGPVRIERRVWGFEFAPFGGILFTDKLRAGVGADGLYWHKVSFGSGVATNVTNFFDVTAFTHVSYNLYSNTSLGIALDTNKKIGMDLTFRF